MTKEIENLTLRVVSSMAGDDHGEYVGDELLMAMSARRFGKRFLQTGQPYRVDDGRVMRVLSGQAHSIINLEPHDLQAGMLLVIPRDTMFEIESMSDEFDIQVFSFRDLPEDVSFKECTTFRLDGDDWLLTGEYFHLLWHSLNRQPLSLPAVRGLQIALLTELRTIYNKESVDRKHRPMSRQEDIFHRFTQLVNKHAEREHTIAFYADRLCLTPNYLGAVVREVSGKTVIQWVNRYIIQQAKLQLKYSDSPVWQIAERLNFPNPSFFSKFFKRETGMTPGEYRQK